LSSFFLGFFFLGFFLGGALGVVSSMRFLGLLVFFFSAPPSLSGLPYFSPAGEFHSVEDRKTCNSLISCFLLSVGLSYSVSSSELRSGVGLFELVEGPSGWPSMP